MTYKQKKILFIIIGAIIILESGVLLYLKLSAGKKVPEKPKKKPTPVQQVKKEEPVLAASALDGTMVDPALANRHPLAIMVENHPQARPQTGLIDASIVYETLAEGGISRFMGIYGPKIPAKVGPVRSARTYFVDWALEYDAFYAHVGGSNDALAKINVDGVKDLNQFSIGSAAFWREKSNVALEHTMYTDPQKLYNVASSRNWSLTGNITAYQFKDDIAAAQRPAAGTLSIDFSGNATYAAKFIYNPTTNSYSRLMAGAPHNDKTTGVQITPKNIVVQYASEIYKTGKKDHDVQTIGSGTAKIYMDGQEIIGTWTKTAKGSRTIFKDASGVQIIFNKGQTWIAVVRPNAPVSYSAT